MKKYLLLCLGLFICISIQSQNTIVNSNSSWSTLTYGLGALNIPCCVVTEFTYFERDTLIDAISYKKVFSCDDSLRENIIYEGLIREQDKKTYFIPANSEIEYLLYDFSLEQGMSIDYSFWRTREPSVFFYVNNVDSVEINGFMKKRIELTLNGRIVDIWIEEIGSLSGILHPMYSGFLAGNVRLLLCYRQNNELLYNNSVYSQCYYDKAEDIVSVQTIEIVSVQTIEIDNVSVFPNPVNDILTISTSNKTITRIELFDILGKRVYSEIYKNTFDVSSFPKGIYMLKVYDINEQVSVFKIIKK